MRTSDSVAALKNVDFPHEGFPISPSSIMSALACGDDIFDVGDSKLCLQGIGALCQG